MTPLENLLSRLDMVQNRNNPRYAASFVACCPAHDDRRPSLGIAQTDDGIILINCLSHQCAPAEILAAVGLEFVDLYEKPLHTHRKGIKKPFPAADILLALSLEITFVCIYAGDLIQGRQPTDDDFERLKLAFKRINAAIDTGGLR